MTWIRFVSAKIPRDNGRKLDCSKDPRSPAESRWRNGATEKEEEEKVEEETVEEEKVEEKKEKQEKRRGKQTL